MTPTRPVPSAVARVHQQGQRIEYRSTGRHPRGCRYRCLRVVLHGHTNRIVRCARWDTFIARPVAPPATSAARLACSSSPAPSELEYSWKSRASVRGKLEYAKKIPCRACGGSRPRGRRSSRLVARYAPLTLAASSPARGAASSGCPAPRPILNVFRCLNSSTFPSFHWFTGRRYPTTRE